MLTTLSKSDLTEARCLHCCSVTGIGRAATSVKLFLSRETFSNFKLNLIFFFGTYSSNPWSARTASFQSIRATDRSLPLTRSSKRLSPSSRGMFSRRILSMKRNKLCRPPGKFIFIIFVLISLTLIRMCRFNAKWIPKTDDTLNATSRRYGTETMP